LHHVADQGIQQPILDRKRLRNRLMTCWLQMQTYIMSRASESFHYGVSRDTSFVRLLLQSHKDAETALSTDELLKYVTTPVATEMKSPQIRWMAGMSLVVNASCRCRAADVDVGCVFDCAEFSMPSILPEEKGVAARFQFTKAKATLTQVVESALRSTVELNTHMLGIAECKRCTTLSLSLCLCLARELDLLLSPPVMFLFCIVQVST
jgi:hypothetical protein